MNEIELCLRTIDEQFGDADIEDLLEIISNINLEEMYAVEELMKAAYQLGTQEKVR